MRWRIYPVCFVADIIKMYRQVMVGEDDALKYQRLLWRSSQEEEVKEYTMMRVTFGVSSSPYLAVKSIQQLAKDECKEHKVAASSALRDFYMDDYTYIWL